MKTPGILFPENSAGKANLTVRQRVLPLAALAVIVGLAAILRFANLNAIGYANHYYTAAIKSMLQSWHNFFFVAAEPGASVSVDKPPVGFWIQAISAYFLGVNGFSVVLPQILAGIISIIVIYHLVRRSFGTVAGLLAALVLAITPVVVATDRNNTIDSTLILTLLLAAWAFIKATETGRLRYLLLGAILVGIGFNIKMLQAYLPLPAFFVLYFMGSGERVLQKAGKLLLTSTLLVVVSLSWAVAVDLTPTDQRPYVGSSTDNSETNLILVYNGIDRLLGMFGRRGPNPGSAPGPQSPGPMQQFSRLPQYALPGNQNTFPQGMPNGSYFPFAQRNPGGSIPQRRMGNNPSPAFNNRGGGFMNTGQPGALRLFIAPLSKEVSWLLPLSLISIALLAIGSRWQWPISTRHQALILWSGWLVTCVVFFSIAGFFHEYYLSMLAAPLAALVAIGVTQLWKQSRQRPWLPIGILVASVAATLAFQVYTAKNFIQNIWWLPELAALFTIGLGMLLAAVISHKWDFRYTIGFILLILTLLVTPGIWSVLTNLSASQNQSLPSAYSGGNIGPVSQRGLQINQALLTYLQADTQDVKYLMAVPSAMQGADYILATGRPVLYMGGFMGQDEVVTSDDLARMVSNGELRFIYWGADRGRPGGSNTEITAWVASACTALQGFDTATRNAGAPDGTTMGNYNNARNNSFTQSPAGMESISLYECGG
jgi:4-amino-4-deoxy-L-arabinose transferase-like glycosyltransferase